MPLCGFAGDFANVLKHLRTILNMAYTTGFQQSKGALVNGLDSNPKIKFWHILFNVSLSKDISAGLSLNCIASLHLMKTEWTTLWLAPSPTWNLRVSTPLLQLWCTTRAVHCNHIRVQPYILQVSYGHQLSCICPITPHHKMLTVWYGGQYGTYAGGTGNTDYRNINIAQWI